MNKDKLTKVVTSLIRPVAIIQACGKQSGTFMSLRDSVVHTKEEVPADLEWKEVFRTADHEERQLGFKFIDFELQRCRE